MGCSVYIHGDGDGCRVKVVRGERGLAGKVGERVVVDWGGVG